MNRRAFLRAVLGGAAALVAARLPWTAQTEEPQWEVTIRNITPADEDHEFLPVGTVLFGGGQMNRVVAHTTEGRPILRSAQR